MCLQLLLLLVLLLLSLSVLAAAEVVTVQSIIVDIYYIVGGMSLWLERRSLTGKLSLI